ncbi:MAG: PAS domain S-box protein [Haloarculaceae archaeon]
MERSDAEAFDAAPVALFVVDPGSGTLGAANARFRGLTGHAEPDLRGRPVEEVIEPSASSVTMAALAADLPEDPVAVPATLATADGGRRAVRLRVSPVEWDGERALCGAVDEWTGSVRAGRDRGSSDREHVERLAANTPDVLWIFTADFGELVFVNEAYERIWGQPVEDLAADPTAFLDGIHPEDRPIAREAMADLAAGESVDVEYRVNEAADFGRHVWVHGEPLYEDGRVAEIGGFVREITERKRRTQELVRQRNLVEHVPVGVFRARLSGEDWELEQANPALAAMLGVAEPETLRGRSVDSLLADDASLAERDTALRRSGVVTFECEFAARGEPFWGRVTTVLHDDASGRPVADGIVEDVTERRRHHRQFAVVDRILRHNVRNDVAVVLGYAEYLLTAVDDEDLADAARRIVDHAEALARTAEKEREIVKTLSTDDDDACVDVAVELDRLTARIAERIPAATVELDCPPAAPVRASSRIDVAIRELLENALVHGSDAPTVGVTVTCTDDVVRVAIADDGPGLPESEVAVVVGEADIDQLTHGTGTGLWLARWLVTASGGRIDFDTDDAGTTVTVTLPSAHDGE